MTHHEHWTQDGNQNGWKTPPKAIWPLRIWGVRHIRAVRYDLSINPQHAAGYGEWVLYAIAQGLC
jgi:hypothetical protein